MKPIKEITCNYMEKDISFPIEIPACGTIVELFCDSEFVTKFIFKRPIFIQGKKYCNGDNIEESFKEALYLDQNNMLSPIIESDLMYQVLTDFIDDVIKTCAAIKGIDMDETISLKKDSLYESCFHILTQVCEYTCFVIQGIMEYAAE